MVPVEGSNEGVDIVSSGEDGPLAADAHRAVESTLLLSHTHPHPFFMNKQQRETQKKRALQAVLDSHIAASNALNRSIQSRIGNVPADAPVAFFDRRRREKTVSGGAVVDVEDRRAMLARCGLDAAPFPEAFQIMPLAVHQTSVQGHGAAPTAMLPELSAFERGTWGGGPFFRVSEAFGHCYSRPTNGGGCYSAALRDLVTAEFGRRLLDERAVVFLLIGPPGCGKTQLAHDLARAHGHAVIELNTTGNRSGRAFEPVLTALAHQAAGTAGSRSLFFQKTQPRQEPGRFLVLVDEVDVVFEEERGFWSGLNAFLATSRPKTPVIITANSPARYLTEQLGLRFPETTTVFEWPGGAIDWRHEGLQSHVVRLFHNVDTTFDYEFLGLQDERVRWCGGEGSALELSIGQRVMFEALRTGFIPKRVPATAEADPSLDELQSHLESLSWIDGVERNRKQRDGPLFVWEEVPFSSFPDASEPAQIPEEYAETQLERVFVPLRSPRVFLADPSSYVAVARQLARRFQSSFGEGVWRVEAAWTVIVVEGEHAGSRDDVEMRACVSRFKRRHRPFYRCLPDDLVDAVLSL